MTDTPCPSYVTVGEQKARGTIRVRCALTAPHALHTATFNGVSRQWSGSGGSVREWSATL